MLGETRDQVVGGGVGGADEGLDLVDRDDGVQVEVFEGAVAVSGGAAELVGHDVAVDFADEADRDGEGVETPEAVVEGVDVVDDFVDVLGGVGGEDLGFGGEHVVERALGALDLTGEDGFLSDVHQEPLERFQR